MRIETELAGCFLLQRRGRKRRCRISPALLLFDLDRRQFTLGCVEQGLLDLAGRCLIFEAELLDFLAFVFYESGYERLLVLADVGFDRPVLACFEFFDLELAFDDHAQCRALYPSGRQAALHFLPQQRRQVESDKIVERASSLLRRYEIAGDVPRMLDRFADGSFGDFIEDDAVHRLFVERAFFLQQFDQMPGDRFTLAIGVSRKVERIRFLERADDRFDMLFVFLDELVLHREALLRIDRAFLGHEVTDVTVRRHNVKVFSQVFANGLGFGR